MRRTITSIFHLWLKWLEKGRGAGIEHFIIALQMGLLTFLNINMFQLALGFKPLLKYNNNMIYFIGYAILVFLFFKTFLPKSYLLNQSFTPAELKVAKIILITYFTLTPLTLALSMFLFHQK